MKRTRPRLLAYPCGHGCGFWDGDYDWLERDGIDVGEKLTELCDKFPARSLYLGDSARFTKLRRDAVKPRAGPLERNCGAIALRADKSALRQHRRSGQKQLSYQIRVGM